MCFLRFKIVVALLFGVLSLSGTIAFASDGSIPTYDCTNKETQDYIKQVTFNMYMPSNIKTPEEFKKSYLELKKKQEEAGDDSSCSTIFSDGKLKEGWKDVVSALRELELPSNPLVGLNATVLKALMDKVKAKSKQAISDAISALGADICKVMGTEYLTNKLLDKTNEKYNIDARELSVSEFADDLTRKGMDNVGFDMDLLLSKDELEYEMSSKTKDILRKKRKALWDKF